jgi:mannitol-1-phosphate/altronate dehydrogenase
MKLRMLNGSHSFLAYLGYLAGYQHISDCMQDADLRLAAHRLMMTEQAPTLKITDVDLGAYADSLTTRFSNPALKHRTWQIAMDGSQKLPQRLLDGIRVHLAQGTAWPLLALGVAGWMRYVSGIDDAGEKIDIRDPLSEKIARIVANSRDDERVVALLTLSEIFGTDLPHNATFVENVQQAWQRLVQTGARQAIITTLNS